MPLPDRYAPYSALPRLSLKVRLGRLTRGAASVASIAVTVLGLLAVTFVIGRVIPIDPVLRAVGDHAAADVYEKARHDMGLDRPIYVQFGRYVASAAHGDFGTSLLTSNPVIDDVRRVFPATLELATVATLIGVLLGIPAGVMAATHQGKWPDQAIRVVGLFGYSVPVFWIGLMGLLLFYVDLGWVAGPGRNSVAYDDIVDPVTGVLIVDALLQGEWDAARDAVQHLVLPASILGYFSVAYISRMTRSFMVEQLRQEYITTARVKGASERRVVWRHALGNVALPLVTVAALSYGNLLEGAVLTETVFAWPGLGQYITNALLNADMNAVLGGTTVVGAVYILLNLGSDLLYRLLDPRARR